MAGLLRVGSARQAPVRTTSWGTQWGQLNRLFAASTRYVLTRQTTGAAFFFAAPCLVYTPLLRGLCLRASVQRSRIVTWLILPVVICLSQRLSHACLSISNYTVKLRMAH